MSERIKFLLQGILLFVCLSLPACMAPLEQDAKDAYIAQQRGR